MTIETYHHPSSREILCELFDRLARVQAAAGSLHSLADMHDTGPTALAEALQSLEQDLLIAAREANGAAARIGN
jgi:hypothetical protein